MENQENQETLDIESEVETQLAEYAAIEANVYRIQDRLRRLLQECHQSQEERRRMIQRLDGGILTQELQAAGPKSCRSRAVNSKMWKLSVFRHHRRSAISSLNYLARLERRFKRRLRRCWTFLRIINRARRSLLECPGQPVEKVLFYYRDTQ